MEIVLVSGMSWMDESSLINKIRPNKKKFNNNQAKVSNSITASKKWHLQDLRNTILDEIIDKNSFIPIPITKCINLIR